MSLESPSPPPAALFCEADILLPSGGGGFPASILPSLSARFASFEHEGGRYRAAELAPWECEEVLKLFPGASRTALRQYIGEAGRGEAAFALKARAHAHWASVSRFCSACGSPLEPGSLPDQRGGMACPSCRRVFFPRISPAVIVLVHRGREILLAHNRKFAPGRHGLIAGFVEAGESLEETLRRELMEEAGIEVGEPRYVSSQPWPFPDSLMLGFEAEYLSGEARPDGDELDSLGWYTAENLPGIPPKGSVARQLIDRFFAPASLDPRS